MPHPGVDNSRHITASDKKYYAYYQWVCFVLFIQGVMFYVPYYLWKIWEGGHMRAITMGMQIAILADNLTKLNQIYGNMLNAMQGR